MFWGILNLILAILEMVLMWGFQYCFMKVNSRTIFRKKKWYLLSFTAAGILEYFCIILAPGRWIWVVAQLGTVVFLAFFLFHRKAFPIILDVVFFGMIFLGMELGIFISNSILYTVGLEAFPSLACLGCMSMAIKIPVICLIAVPMIKWCTRQKENKLTIAQSAAMMILPAFSMFFIYSILQMNQVYGQLYGIKLVIADIILLILLNACYLYLLKYLLKVNLLEQEKRLEQEKNQIQFSYYETLEQRYRESRKVLHDMKNHLQAVEQLYQEKNPQAGEKYVSDLYHMIHVLGEKYYSSNHMLNIILNEKLSRAQKLGIFVKSQVGEVPFDDIRDIDLTIIFANLLDNAIEACSKCRGEAYLELKIDMVQAFRVIRITNSVPAWSEEDKNLPGREKEKAAGKGNTGQHMGLGLSNVRDTLEKYHGSLEQTATDQEFCVSIMIPVKE